MLAELKTLGEWNGQRIYCHPADETYVNASQMAKPFGKKWNDYWRLKSTQSFIEALAFDTGIPASKLVDVRRGGSCFDCRVPGIVTLERVTAGAD
jgi:hypothetical protein